MISPQLIVLLVAALVSAGGGAFGVYSWYSPRLALEKARVETLSADVNSQNDALEALREAGDKRAKGAAVALASARAAAAGANARAQQLLMAQKPVDVSDCQAASDLIRLELAK